MSLDHADFCNCAECVGRFGLGPRPPRPAPPAGASSTEVSSDAPPIASSGFRIEMNDPGAVVGADLPFEEESDEEQRERLRRDASNLDELTEAELDELERATNPER